MSKQLTESYSISCGSQLPHHSVRNITPAEQCATEMAAMCRDCVQKLVDVVGAEAAKCFQRKPKLDRVLWAERPVNRL